MKQNGVFTSLREKVFEIKPESIGVHLENDEQVYSAIVDMNINNKIVTLVFVFDGSVSLYYSNGKCDIGLGKEKKIRDAAISFLVSSGQCIKFSKKTKDFVLPSKNETNVFLFARGGIYKTNINNNNKDQREIKFLYFLFQNVINKIRENFE